MTTQRWKILLAILLLIALVMPGSAVFAKGPPDGSGGGGGGGGGDHGPPDVEASNNLSWPLLQPDEVKLFSEPLPFTAAKTADCWDFDTDFECEYFCETTDCPEPLRGYDADDYGHAFDPIPLYEQGVGNLWRADYSLDQSPTKVALIDWGDNLEAKDWRLGAMIRVEVRLKGELADQTMIYYPMYHMFGEGVTERWGTSYDPTSSDLEWTTDKPYIYANGARLLIQEVVCDDPVWNGARWKCEGTDMPVVYEDEDDMSTEVNIGGYAIYGFRWVTRDCRAAGTCRANMDYRLTFSLPTESSTNPSNVQISKTGGTIIEIAEEEPTDEEDPHAASITEEPGGNQAEVGEGYTWIDVMLTQGGGGKKTRSLDMELEMEQERECDQSCDCAFECDGDGICEQECEQEYQELHNQNGDDDVQGQGDQEQERERERERSNMHLFLPFVTNQ